MGEIILDGNLTKLSELAKDPTTSVLKVWIAKAAAVGIQKGDLSSLELILNRMLGKVRDKVDINGEGFQIVIRDFSQEKK